MSVRIEQIGDCTLYLGDCREILPTLGKVDAVVTDPPYGIGVENNFGIGNRKDRAKDRSLKWDTKPSADMFKLLTGVGENQIIWGANYFSRFSEKGGAIVWDKMQPLPDSSQCEIASCTHFQKVFKYAERWTNFVNSKSSEHPTEKPVGLMAFCLGLFPAAQTILDPFMGSGTTGVACVKLGRKFIGIEIEPKYFDIACRRIDEAVRSPDLFVAAEPAPKPEQQELLS